MTNTTPVLIIGAGPTGLTMATCLQRYHIPFRIIDKQIKPVTTSNAIVIQTRTLELWDDLGLLSTALSHGQIIREFDIYSNKKKIVSINLNCIDSTHPFILGLAQSQTEKMLLEHLAQKNISVELEVELIDFTETQNGILAQLRHQDGSIETLQTNWLLACDGGHSLVREKARLEFRGKELEQHFVLADLPLKSTVAQHEICLFLADAGPLIIARYNQQNARIIAEVTHDPKLQTAKTITAEQLDQIFKSRCPMSIQAEPPIWTSGFWIHERLSSAYRRNQIFLLGDAAHIHSPAGGQGMNTGIQDAYNLAWKLALVIQGRAKETILASYQDERREVAKTLLRNTTAMTYMMTTRNFLLKKLRNYVMPWILSFAKNRKRFAMLITQLNISYKNSPLTRDYLAGHQTPTAGSLMPDVQLGQERLFDSVRGTEFCLLIFTGKNTLSDFSQLTHLNDAIQKKYPEMIKVILISAAEDVFNNWQATNKILDKTHIIHDRYHVIEPSFYLIRPDKYIGFRGNVRHTDQLFEYLTQFFPMHHSIQHAKITQFS